MRPGHVHPPEHLACPRLECDRLAGRVARDVQVLPSFEKTAAWSRRTCSSGRCPTGRAARPYRYRPRRPCPFRRARRQRGRRGGSCGHGAAVSPVRARSASRRCPCRDPRSRSPAACRTPRRRRACRVRTRGPPAGSPRAIATVLTTLPVAASKPRIVCAPRFATQIVPSTFVSRSALSASAADAASRSRGSRPGRRRTPSRAAVLGEHAHGVPPLQLSVAGPLELPAPVACRRYESVRRESNTYPEPEL